MVGVKRLGCRPRLVIVVGAGMVDWCTASNIDSYPVRFNPVDIAGPATTAGSATPFSTHFVREGDDTRAMRARNELYAKNIEQRISSTCQQPLNTLAPHERTDRQSEPCDCG